jgi:hypothetical protein
MRQHTDNNASGRDENSLMRSSSSDETSSVNTDMFLDEKKELLQEKNFVKRVIGCAIALCINVGIYFYVLSVFISEKFYNAESS